MYRVGAWMYIMFYLLDQIDTHREVHMGTINLYDNLQHSRRPGETLSSLYMAFHPKTYSSSLLTPSICTNSVSKINVAPPGMGPIPRSPYPYSGGIVSVRFSPTHISKSPSSHLENRINPYVSHYSLKQSS